MLDQVSKMPRAGDEGASSESRVQSVPLTVSGGPSGVPAALPGDSRSNRPAPVAAGLRTQMQIALPFLKGARRDECLHRLATDESPKSVAWSLP
jgi:hypothetical protein